MLTIMQRYGKRWLYKFEVNVGCVCRFNLWQKKRNSNGSGRGSIRHDNKRSLERKRRHMHVCVGVRVCGCAYV